MTQQLRQLGVLLLALVLSMALFATAQAARKEKKPAPPAAEATTEDSLALEAELIEIYKLLGQADHKGALSKAETLVKQHPNFQLGQLLYGDLLATRVRPVKVLGEFAPASSTETKVQVQDLREESDKRIDAIRDRPKSGLVPAQFVQLASKSKHAIAVDVSRSRLYLFENTTTGMRLVSDFYVSIGKAGSSKQVEGDLRTPLGAYFITGHLDKKSLADLYGSGALPLNYPNVLDQRRGKSGRGIWLHGTPAKQFARAPRATDGCVVASNPDIEKILRTIEPQATPIVIAPKLEWVDAKKRKAVYDDFQGNLQQWLSAKSAGKMDELLKNYAEDFSSQGKPLATWKDNLKRDIVRAKGNGLQLNDLSLIRWTDSDDIMLVSFNESVAGTSSSQEKRQYWMRKGNKWRIIFEGAVS